MDLISALNSIGFGSIVGLAGGLAEKFIDIKAKRLDYLHEETMRKIDVKESELDRAHEVAMADKHIERAVVEGEVKIEALEAAAFASSQEGAGKSTLLTYVRAAITGYMLLASTALTAVVWHKVGGISSLTQAELIEMLQDIVEAAIFLTVTCIAWWFAARPGNLRFKR